MGTHSALATAFLALVVGQPPRERDDRPNRPDPDRVKAKPQKKQDATKDRAFEKAAPRIGEALPNLTVWDADGKPFSMRSLHGHYAVLVFGCLT